MLKAVTDRYLSVTAYFIYRVRMAPRLTRHDCAILERILRAEAATAKSPEETHGAVLAVLKDLSERDVMDWINQEAEVGEDRPGSVQEIVRRVLDIHGDLPEDVQAACEKVYDRILGSFGKVLITHYFLRVVVPVMEFTHAQAWAIITLRDRCWYDHESQTQKEFAIVRGGLDTLAKWLGVATKSVNGWLKDPVFSAFVHQADMSRLDIPDEWRISGTAIFLVSLQEPLLAELLGEQAWKKRDSISEKMRLHLGKNETRLNNLIKPHFNHKKPYQTPSTSTSVLTNGKEPVSAAVADLPAWDLDRIFKLNRVHHKKRKELTGVGAQKFISWLLYAVSTEGKGIEMPLGYALDRLSLSDGDGAGGKYEAHASLPPARLIDLILGRAQDHDWDSLMGRESRRPLMLLPILLGEDALREARTVEGRVTEPHPHCYKE